MEIEVIKYDRETDRLETRSLGPNVADYGWHAVYRRIRFQGNVNDYSSKTVVSSVPALLLNVGVAVCIVLLTYLILDSICLRGFPVGVVVAALFFAATLIVLLILATKTGPSA